LSAALDGAAGRVAEQAIPNGYLNTSSNSIIDSVASGKTTLIYGANSAIDDHANFTTLWNALALLVSDRVQ
jgi:hypothetical protein